MPQAALFDSASCESRVTLLMRLASRKQRARNTAATPHSRPPSHDYSGTQHVCIPPALRHHRLPRRIPALSGGADGREATPAHPGRLLCGLAHVPGLLPGHAAARLSLRTLDYALPRFQLAAACLSRDARSSSRSAVGAENRPRHLEPKLRSSGLSHLRDPRLHHLPTVSPPRRNQPPAAI